MLAPVIRDASAQEKSPASDPRFQALIGVWEGRVQFRGRGETEDRILIIEERNGQLLAKYGIPGKTLEDVGLSVEFFEGSGPKVSFRTRAGNTISLVLIKEDWLSGVFVVARRGTGTPERPMQLLRRKN
jgi:hypothetical protein